MTAKKNEAAPKPDDGRTIPIAAPNLETAPSEVARWYWVGARLDAPRSSIDVAGVTFNKITETIHAVEGQSQQRVKHPGTCVRLTENKLEVLAERLSRMVIRGTAPSGAATERGAGDVLDEQPANRTPKIILSIPTEEQLKAVSASGRPRYRKFIARPNDRPLAEVLYCVPCPEGKNRPRGIDDDLPPPLSETGIQVGNAPTEPLVGPRKSTSHAGMVDASTGDQLARLLS
tara:strand:+ start:81337 stop:82029 length:693 start_codon:yes stop_codon:yes gene_type:complete